MIESVQQIAARIFRPIEGFLHVNLAKYRMDSRLNRSKIRLLLAFGHVNGAYPTLVVMRESTLPSNALPRAAQWRSTQLLVRVRSGSGSGSRFHLP